MRITLAVFSSALIWFLILPSVSFAVEKNSRVYIPVSGQATILKENDSQSLLIKDYLNSTRSVDGSTQESQIYYPYGDSPERESH